MCPLLPSIGMGRKGKKTKQQLAVTISGGAQAPRSADPDADGWSVTRKEKRRLKKREKKQQHKRERGKNSFALLSTSPGAASDASPDRKARKRAVDEDAYTAGQAQCASPAADVYTTVFGQKGPHVELQFAGKRRTPMHMQHSEAQAMLLWAANVGARPSWMNVRNHARLGTVVVMNARCMGDALLDSHAEHLTHLDRVFPPSQRMLAYSSCSAQRVYSWEYSMLYNLSVKNLTGPGAVAEARRLKEVQATRASAVADALRGDTSLKGRLAALSAFVMSRDERIANDYPMRDQGPVPSRVASFHGFVSTEPSPGALKHAVVAVDCEMCRTLNGLELTRVSLVDSRMRVLLDTFCIPADPIIDYNTRYSGITADILKDVTNTLEDIQRMVKEIVSSETILVGHSLESDLYAMKLFHDCVVDTAVLYPRSMFSCRQKHSLRVLAKTHLNEEIQVGSHDSIVDAEMALRLALLKAEKGAEYGLPRQSGLSLSAALAFDRRQMAMVVPSSDTYTMAEASVYHADSDAKAASQTLAAACKKGSPFAVVWTKLVDLYNLLEVDGAGRNPVEPEAVRDTIKGIDAAVGQVWDGLPPWSLLVFFTGGRRLDEVKALQSRKADDPSSWGSDEAQQLKKAIQQAKRGAIMWAVKPHPEFDSDDPVGEVAEEE